MFDSRVTPYFGVVQPSNAWTIMTYDTRTQQGTAQSGQTWIPSPSHLGAHTLTSQTNVNATNCQMTSTTFPQNQAITVNVLECAPKWRTNSSGNITRFGTSVGPVTNAVYVPPTLVGSRLDAALIRVVANWNTALTNNGVPQQFARVTAPCGGGHCINLVEAAQTNGKCAQILTPTTADGIITSPSTLEIDPKMESEWGMGR